MFGLLDLFSPAILLRRVVNRCNELCKAQGYEILVLQFILWSDLFLCSILARLLRSLITIQVKDVCKDVQIAVDVEQLVGVFICETVGEVIETGPGNGTQAETAWFVSGQKETLLDIRPFITRDLEELFNAPSFAVPDWRPTNLLSFLVRIGMDYTEVGLAQNGRSKQL